MEYPKLELIADPQKDAEVGVNFIACESLKYWEWFLPQELQFIIKEEITLEKKQEILSAFAGDFHLKNKEAIQHGLQKAKANWQRIEHEYYRLVDELFKQHPWPEGNYVGAITIFNMYPRWIEGKFFSFPYAHRIDGYANITIAHEMLHFLFFDYIQKRYGLQEHSKIKGREDDYVWKVSEVFNNVVLNSKPFQDLIGIEDDNYVDPPSMYTKMKQDWAENNDIDWLLDKWLTEGKEV